MDEVLITLRSIQKDLDIQKNTIRESAAEVTAKVTENVNNNIDARFKAWEEKFEDLKQKIYKQEQRLDMLDKQARKRNVVIFGIQEQKIFYSELEKTVTDFLNKHLLLQIAPGEIQDVRRIGKRSENPRPIVVTLTTFGRKIEIMKQKKLLKDTTYYIKEDYPQHVLERRRELQKQIEIEAGKGNRAIIKYDKLVILKKSEHIMTTTEKNKKRFLPTSPHEKENSTNSISQSKKKNKTSSAITTLPSERPEGMTRPGLLNYLINKTPTIHQTPQNKDDFN